MLPLNAQYVTLWVIEGFQTLVTVGLLRQYKILRQASLSDAQNTRNSLPVGADAPGFSLLDLRSGRTHELRSGQGFGRVLLFLSPSCSFCLDIVRRLNRLPSDGLLRVVPICFGAERDCKRLLDRLPDTLPLLSDPSRDVSRRFGFSGVPGAITLTPLGRIRAYSHPTTAEDVLNLVSDARLDFEVDSSSDESSAQYFGKDRLYEKA
jgi:hypothetical protein